MKKTFVIAEAGANHNRDWKIATDLITAAKSAEADAVKFQIYSSSTLYASNTPDFAGYKNVNKLIESIELPRNWLKDLKQCCDDKGIEFMSTPFDEKAVEELVALDVKRIKIAGFEATDPRFVEIVASTKLPIIMSAGIGFSWRHWGLFSEIFNKFGNHVTLLHCNNAYPTPIEDANLGTIPTLLNLKNVNEVGYSDHTRSTLTPALAVSNGATCIEKHYTLDRTMKGPDHPFALEPGELTEMVKYIREAEKSKGVKKGVSLSEKMFTPAMRSVVTKKDIKVGEVLTQENITTKRPCMDYMVPALDYFNILGFSVTKDIPADTPINKSDIPGYYEVRNIIPWD